MNKFDHRDTALHNLIDNKNLTCAAALEDEFDSALLEGEDIRGAYTKAIVFHLLKDHDAADKYENTLTIPETDEAVVAEITRAINEVNDDGLAQDRINLVVGWYERIRSWGVPVAVAYSIAAAAGQEEWEDEHDMDEAEAIKHLDGIPSNASDSALKELTIKTFYAERNKGNNVLSSLRKAVDRGQQALQDQLFYNLLGGRLN